MRKRLTPHLQPSAAVNGVTQLVTQRRLSLKERESDLPRNASTTEPRTMNFSIATAFWQIMPILALRGVATTKYMQQQEHHVQQLHVAAVQQYQEHLL
jgi:hypothetical protein